MPVTIDHLNPCKEARLWLLTQPDPVTAWDSCPRGDWMLWLAAKLDCPRPIIVKAAAAIARLVLHRVPEGEDRPRLAIEAAEAWAANPTAENQETARAAADAAYCAAAAYADVYAYASVSAAADAAAAYADASYAIDAYAACAAAGTDADADAAKIEMQKQTTDVVRSFIPASVIVSLLEKSRCPRQ